MAKSRSTDTKKEAVRKPVKRHSKPKQKISIPMILNCDGNISDLLPWFVKVVDLLNKDGRKNVRSKISGNRRKKAAKSKEPALSEDIELPQQKEAEAEADLLGNVAEMPDAAPQKSLTVRRQTSRKAASTRARKQPILRSKRRNLGPKRVPFRPRPKRKSLISPRFFKPTSDSPMGFALADIPAMPAMPCCEEPHVDLASSPSLALAITSASVPTETELESVVAAASAPPSSTTIAVSDSLMAISNSSILDGAVARFNARMMMFLHAQSAALEAFNAVGDGLHITNRNIGNPIPYNFQDAWNEAVNQASNSEPQPGSHCAPDLTMAQLCLAAFPKLDASSSTGHIKQPIVSNTAEDNSIFDHIRNSLGDICSPKPNPSTSSINSEHNSGNVADSAANIFNHIRSSLRNPSSQDDQDDNSPSLI